jgi:hypothetical protein
MEETSILETELETEQPSQAGVHWTARLTFYLAICDVLICFIIPILFHHILATPQYIDGYPSYNNAIAYEGFAQLASRILSPLTFVSGLIALVLAFKSQWKAGKALATVGVVLGVVFSLEALFEIWLFYSFSH